MRSGLHLLCWLIKERIGHIRLQGDVKTCSVFSGGLGIYLDLIILWHSSSITVLTALYQHVCISDSRQTIATFHGFLSFKWDESGFEKLLDGNSYLLRVLQFMAKIYFAFWKHITGSEEILFPSAAAGCLWFGRLNGQWLLSVPSL